MDIGIIGQGFVGNAVYQKFKNFFSIYTYDLDKKKCNSSLRTVKEKCKVIFVCVPTPEGDSGWSPKVRTLIFLDNFNSIIV